MFPAPVPRVSFAVPCSMLFVWRESTVSVTFHVFCFLIVTQIKLHIGKSSFWVSFKSALLVICWKKSKTQNQPKSILDGWVQNLLTINHSYDKFFDLLHSPKYILNFRIKNQACHGWSGCNGTVFVRLLIPSRTQTNTDASAPTVTSTVFNASYRLCFGTVCSQDLLGGR